MSSASAPPLHFRRWVGQVSNLDRCTRCGRPRSVHGPDWSCPEATTTRRTSVVLVVVGLALAVGCLILHSRPGGPAFIVQSVAFLAGVGLIVAGLTAAGRSR